MPRVLSTSVPHAVEKLTKQIRVGQMLLVSERLHAKLVHISQLTGNAPMLAALRMSAEEGSDRIIEALSKHPPTIIDKDVQQELKNLIEIHANSITECARANSCDELIAIGILLAIGIKHGSVNGYRAPVQRRSGPVGPLSRLASQFKAETDCEDDSSEQGELRQIGIGRAR